MMFSRGDRVRVVGFGGKEGVLRVWDVRPHGLLLCTEDGYPALLAGDDAALVGFPMADIRGLYSDMGV